jgi:hypothetical protein
MLPVVWSTSVREQFVVSFYVFFLLYPELTAMNSDSPSPEFPRVSYVYDSSGRLLEQREESVAVPGMTGGETIEVRSMPVAFEHDNERRLFTLTGPDGKIERFRDNPTRYLMVEPDPETGAMRPVIKRGRPAFIYLCREEREL